MFVVQRQESKREENAMKEFIAKFGDQISGVVSGFDRLVFRGHLRGISYVTGMKQYLWANQVLNKEFGAHAEKITARLKEASLAEAGKLQRPVRYLASSKTSKEDVARSIAAKDGITSGPVCVLTSVEPCWSFDIYKNRETKKLDVVKRERHCLFLYHYWMHPTWFQILPPGVRIHERTDPELVSVSHPDLPERAGMAGAADGRSRSELRTTGQLLSVGGGLGEGATIDGRSTASGLAATVG
jgi:hypothetical protein